MNKQEWVIEVDGLVKSYQKTEVLKGVSFKVKHGSIYALLGANGAGKTTVINILTTLLAADDGSAVVNGYAVATQAAEVRKSLSLTGQFAAVDDILTARENLVMIGELRHVNHPAKLANELLERFELVDAADRRAVTFSGGMRRRLDIAMSLIGDPAVIFLDEPTTGLDPQSRNAMWAMIRSLADRGTTVFLTTQYLEEADQLADQIAILNSGVIVSQGTPHELKRLLPHGQIELALRTQSALQKSETQLMTYAPRRSDENLTLTVTTDGSIAGLTKLLNEIEAKKIDVVEFAQKTPTLDDAFFKIIEQDKEKKQ